MQMSWCVNVFDVTKVCGNRYFDCNKFVKFAGMKGPGCTNK